MIVAIIGERGIAYDGCRELLTRLGHVVVDDIAGSDVAVAPLLQTKISTQAAYKKGEPLSAATWFWASDGLDEGDICEQEIVRIDYDLRPRDFYASRILPAMFRTLERAIAGISTGVARRVPQMHEHATYD